MLTSRPARAGAFVGEFSRLSYTPAEFATDGTPPTPQLITPQNNLPHHTTPHHTTPHRRRRPAAANARLEPFPGSPFYEGRIVSLALGFAFSRWLYPPPSSY